MNTITQDQNITRRAIGGIAAAGAAATLALGMMLGGAVPAEAATHWGGAHKPKSFICAVFQVCKETKHCSYGHPTRAATTWAEARKVYCHTDRH